MLYRLDKKDGPTTLASVELSTLEAAGWTEHDLEGVLAERIDYLIRENQLLVIARERRWQEEADLLALDEAGTLYIFEIKRTESDPDHLLQVIRYGQIFGQYDLDSLEALFRKFKPSAPRLAEAHKKHFELSETLPSKEFNKTQQFIVVVAGTNLETLEAVSFWCQKGLPLAAITYHVYRHKNEFFLEFHSYSPRQEDYVGLLSNAWIVNTNSTYDPNAFEDMLSESKAAAYGERRIAVDRIQKHDRVFLYHNRVGVIALGKAKSKFQPLNEDDPEQAEHYVPLDMAYVANPVESPDKCVSAAEIHRVTGGGSTFRRTAFNIDKKTADVIEELLKQKHRETKPKA
jgi:hypothetical protein